MHSNVTMMCNIFLFHFFGWAFLKQCWETKLIEALLPNTFMTFNSSQNMTFLIIKFAKFALDGK